MYLLYTHDPTGVYPDDIDPNNTGGESTPARTAQLMRVEADPATGYATAKAGTETVILGAGGTLANIGDENDGRNLSFATCMYPQTANGTPVRDCIASDEDSHTIGTVAFGPDKSLYVSSGDGSNYTNVDARALRSQNLDSLNGKILRIDPMTGNGLPDNPFFQAGDPGSNRSKVWAARLAQPVPVRREPGRRRAVRRRRRLEQLGGDQHREGRQLRLALLRGRHGRPGAQRERRHDEPRPVRVPDERVDERRVRCPSTTRD